MSKGLHPFLQRNVKGSENMITFIAEVQYPKGPGIICAVSFKPIFRSDDTIDIELTFLATKLNVEGSGMAIWLIHQVRFI